MDDRLLLGIELNCKRDIVRARQRSRQLAGLLGYSWTERLLISTRVFQIGWDLWKRFQRGAVRFQIASGSLLVLAGTSPTSATEVSLCQPLPSDAPLDAADIQFAMKQLIDHTPFNLFEEIYAHNEQMNRLLQSVARVSSARSAMHSAA
ncbi:MAG: hypothetical protein KatS3mg105_4745 [Gemmatales bacterium]|nr:MAG: hypothetical protein KatS3mg105_4745 [Gemmatales bacterium]